MRRSPARPRPLAPSARSLPVWGAAVLSAALAASCAGTGAPDERGQLVIVGGGLRAGNAEVIEAFTRGAGERVLVLPTASGIPESSGPGTAEDLRRHADRGQSIEVLEILATTPERAKNPAYTDPIDAADALWFTGGVQSRITAVFRPNGFDTRGYRAVRRLLARDGRVGGTSAGAAMMSDPMIEGGSSRDAVLVGTDGGALEIGRGLGLFTHGLVDQHFLRRGRIGRLVVALEETGTDFGWGIADDRGLFVDREHELGLPLGERAVLQIDAREVEREGRSRRGLRIALLSSGDAIDFAARRVELDRTKDPLPEIDDFEPRAYVPLEPFGADTVTRLLERLSTDPDRAQRAESRGVALVVRADERTRFVARSSNLEGFSVVDAILDVEVDEQGVARAEADAALDALR